MLKRGKKATGHIEMLLGFTFFIGVVLFLFVIMRVGEINSEDYGFLAGKLEQGFLEKTQTEVIGFYVKLNETPAGCVSIDLTNYNLGEGLNSSIVDGRDSELEGVVLNIGPGSQYFYVYLSEDIEEDSLDGCALASDYKIGPIENKSYVSYSRIENLKEEYYSNYGVLRDELGIGEVYDFAIEFPNDSWSMNKTTSNNVNIYVRASRIPVMLVDGTVELKEVWFKVW